LVLFELIKLDDSNKAFNEAIKLNRDIARKYMIPADQYINTGRTLFNQCKYDESFKAFDMATQLYQKNADEWCWRGWALFKRNKLDDKNKAFDNATRLDPEYADAWCGKGMALSKQNMLEDSNKAFEEAVKLNPNIVRKYDNEGWNLIIEAMKGAKGDEIHCRYDGSIHYFENAIQIRSVDKDKQRDPDYADAYVGKGWALFKQNNLKDSNMAFEEAKKLERDIARKLYIDGEYLRKNGMPKEECLDIASLYFDIAKHLIQNKKN
jgi:tetratricopeptide (TPR) repeat protein